MNETTDPTVVIETPEVKETKMSRLTKFAKKLLPYVAVSAATVLVVGAFSRGGRNVEPSSETDTSDSETEESSDN